MAARAAPAESGPERRSDDDAVVIVDRVSKEYQRPKVILFPPVVSIFERGWFRRKRRSEEEAAKADFAPVDRPDAEPGAKGRTASGSAPTPATTRSRDYDVDAEFDEDDEDDDEEDDEEEEAPPAGPVERFWALRDISFRLGPGSALGILGGPEAGKSTLLRIIGGQAFPTEGKVAVRDPVSPLPTHLIRVFKSKGGGGVIEACRLMGIPTRVAKEHQHEIEALAQPLVGPHGEPAPGSAVRLAIAAAVILPSKLILLDEPQEMEEGFARLMVGLLRQRLRAGDSLILASRKPALVEQLCEQAIVLDHGTVVEHRGAKGAIRAYAEVGQGRGSQRGGAGTRSEPPPLRGKEAARPRGRRAVQLLGGAAVRGAAQRSRTGEADRRRRGGVGEDRLRNRPAGRRGSARRRVHAARQRRARHPNRAARAAPVRQARIPHDRRADPSRQPSGGRLRPPRRRDRRESGRARRRRHRPCLRAGADQR